MKTYANDDLAAMNQAIPQPTDLGSLRARLADHVEHARQLGFRVNDLADTVFGSRPEVVSGAINAERPPSSLVELVNDLDACLNRIESSLNRL